MGVNWKLQLTGNTKLHILIIILLTSIAYSNIFQNEFVWDDIGFLTDWDTITNFNGIPSLLKGDLPPQHPGVYRPVRSLFYVFDYWLFELNPTGYHIQSLLIHLICTILVYFVVFEMLRKKSMALMTSLLFGLHPIHTEAITYIAASFDMLGFVFFFSSFYLYLIFLKTKQRSYFLCSLILALIAFFTYEMSLTLPLIIFVYNILFKKQGKKAVLKKNKVYVPYFLLALFYIIIRFFVVNISLRSAYLLNSFYFTTIAMLKVFLKYIYLTLFPFKLESMHYVSTGVSSLFLSDLTPSIALTQSFFELRIIVSILLISSLLFITLLYHKKYPLIAFGIYWFFATLLPVSGLLPQAILMAEKYLYLPLFGFCLLLAFFLQKLSQRISTKYFILLFVVILLFYSGRTFSRNEDWKDSTTLWIKTVEQNPDSAYAHYKLGSAHLADKKLDLARGELELAININPSIWDGYIKLGNIHLLYNNPSEAVKDYKKAIAVKHDNTEAYNNLGSAYLVLGKTDLAVPVLKKALELNPKNEYAHYNLGDAYLMQGKTAAAVAELKETIRLDPNDASAHQRLGEAYLALGDKKSADREFEIARAMLKS